MRLWLGCRSFILATLVMAGGSDAYARETREICLDEKIRTSDVIFIGTVMALEKPSPQLAGVGRYAVVKVDDVFKGDADDEVRFVVSGYSAELNPSCCEVGKVYLFFTKHGYEVFDLVGTEIGLVVQGKDYFHSAINGPFSTFQIHDGVVVGWNPSKACSHNFTASIAEVEACIKTKVSAGE